MTMHQGAGGLRRDMAAAFLGCAVVSVHLGLSAGPLEEIAKGNRRNWLACPPLRYSFRRESQRRQRGGAGEVRVTRVIEGRGAIDRASSLDLSRWAVAARQTKYLPRDSGTSPIETAVAAVSYDGFLATLENTHSTGNARATFCPAANVPLSRQVSFLADGFCLPIDFIDPARILLRLDSPILEDCTIGAIAEQPYAGFSCITVAVEAVRSSERSGTTSTVRSRYWCARERSFLPMRCLESTSDGRRTMETTVERWREIATDRGAFWLPTSLVCVMTTDDAVWTTSYRIDEDRLSVNAPLSADDFNVIHPPGDCRFTFWEGRGGGKFRGRSSSREEWEEAAARFLPPTDSEARGLPGSSEDGGEAVGELPEHVTEPAPPPSTNNGDGAALRARRRRLALLLAVAALVVVSVSTWAVSKGLTKRSKEKAGP